MEAYLGKPKQFEAAEAELAKIAEIIRKDNDKSIFRAMTDIDKSEPNQKLQKILADFFGVKYIKIHWQDSVPNACTPISSFPMMYLKNIEKREESGKFINERLKIYVFLDTALISQTKLNEKEMMAIILHEIGHNFDTSPFYFLCTIPTLLYSPIGWAVQHWVVQLITEIRMGVERFFKKYLSVFYNIGAGLNRLLYHISGPLLGSPLAMAQQVVNFDISNLFRYGMERFSDSFAASYGYAQPLATALDKLQNDPNKMYNRIVRNVPVLNVIDDIAGIMQNIMSTFIGVHPKNQTRMKNMINKLERDLDDPNLPKDLKEELKDNLAAYKGYYENYLNDPTYEKQQMLSAWLRKFNEDMFDGKMDIREVFNVLYEKEEA